MKRILKVSLLILSILLITLPESVFAVDNINDFSVNNIPDKESNSEERYSFRIKYKDNWENLIIDKNSTGFEGITIDNGWLLSLGNTDVSTEFIEQDVTFYLNAIHAIQETIGRDIQLAHYSYRGQNYVKDIHVEGINKLMNTLVKNTDTLLWTGKDYVRMEEYLLLRALTSFFREKENNNISTIELEKYTTLFKNKISLDITLSDESLNYLRNVWKFDIPDGDRTRDIIINYMNDLYDLKVETLTKEFENKYLTDRYIIPILTENYLTSTASTYDKYVAVLYALTATDSNPERDSLLGSIITSKLMYTNKNGNFGFIANEILHVSNALLVDEVLHRIFEDNTLSDAQQLSLFAIVDQRGSKFANNISLPKKYDSMLLDSTNGGTLNREMGEAYNRFENKYNILANSNKINESQMLTVSDRLQYHFYAQQIKNVNTSTELTDLSTVRGDYNFFGYVAPLPLPKTNEFKVINIKEYINFINVVNELPYMRNVMYSEGLKSNILEITKEVNNVEILLYIKQMKNAITFLENRNINNRFDNIISMWYEKLDFNGTLASMETIYNKAQNIGLLSKDMALDYTATSDDVSFTYMFNLDDMSLSPYIRMGIIQSATYVPLETNIYDSISFRVIKNDNFYNFHYQWGYYRKALLIDTSDKAAVTAFTASKRGATRPATLKDLLTPERDIVLYLDNQFYNKEILDTDQEKAFGMLYDPASLHKDPMYEAGLSEENQEVWDKVLAVTNYDYKSFIDNPIYKITKDGITQYAEAQGDWIKNKIFKKWDKALFGRELIDTYTSPYLGGEVGMNAMYSPYQAFAILSGIYRFDELTNHIENEGVQPVFISSANMGKLPGVSRRDRESIFNYALLKNIKDDMSINYKSKLDYNSPVFMDIYGNILTESGVVIIPAATNATLQKEYSIYNAGFISSYGKNYLINSDNKNVMENYLDLFELNDDNEYEFRNVRINSKVDLNRLSTQSNESLEVLYNLYSLQFYSNRFNTELYLSNVWPNVLTGAPIERISYTNENLMLGGNLNNSGLVQAVKLDNLRMKLEANKQNTILSIPNINYIKGAEYGIAFMYKIGLILIVFILLIQVFLKSLSGTVRFIDIIKITTTTALMISLVVIIPRVFDISYYQINKMLLQDEASTILMLNYEKKSIGAELSINSLEVPESGTKMYLRIKDLNVPTQEMFARIMTEPIGTTLQDIYNEASKRELVSGIESFEQKEDKIYMNVNKLLTTSRIATDPKFSTLYQYVDEDIPASFFTPYYVFIDSILGEINKFNLENDIYAYKTDVYAGGETKSLGLVEAYLTSDYFLSGKSNLLKLDAIYGIVQPEYTLLPFSTSDIENMRESYWCPSYLPKNGIEQRINLLKEESIKFVVENTDLIGKVSDETFLKIMALNLSVKHNQLFGIQSMDSLDIRNISTEDLNRLAVGSKSNVITNLALSYSRYIYEQAGELGIYLAALHTMMSFIVGYVKPVITLLVFIVIFISFYVFGLILNKKTRNIAGYFKLITLISTANIAYSLLLKLSLYLPTIAPPLVCLLAQIILQGIFLIYYLRIASLLISDWRNIGYNTISDITIQAKEVIINTTTTVGLDKFNVRRSKTETTSINSDGHSVLEKLRNSDEKRY